MQNKLLFLQAASALPAGLSLADYEYRFYSDNAGKEILSAEITDPPSSPEIQLGTGSGKRTTVRLGEDLGEVLSDSIYTEPVTWGALAGV